MLRLRCHFHNDNVEEVKSSTFAKDYVSGRLMFACSPPADGQEHAVVPGRGGEQAADAPDGEDAQQHRHPPGLGSQRPHDRLTIVPADKKCHVSCLQLLVLSAICLI